MLTDSFFAIAHLLKAPITTSSKNVPDFHRLLIGENIIIFQTKHFKCLYLNKYTLRNLIFGKYLEERKEITRFGWSKKPLQKCWTGVTFGHLS